MIHAHSIPDGGEAPFPAPFRPPSSPSSSPSRARRALRRGARALGALALLAGAARADTVQFSDGTFGAAWASSKILDTTPGALATFTSTTTLADGGPPPCRETSHTYDSGAIVVAHLNTAATYAPSSGTLCAIDVAYDAIHYPGPAGGAVRYRLLLFQNGTWYHHTAGHDVFVGPWTSYIATGLGSGAFTKVAGAGPDVPDFSCAGAPITFGFSTSNSASNGPHTKVSALDNWSVTLHLARQTFEDGSFTGAWTSTKILDTTAGASATFGTTTQPVAGNPGAYREVSHTFSTGAIAVSHFDAANQFDPSLMPVYEVDVSYDLRHFTPALGAVRYHLAIEQGGVVFVGPFDDIFPDAWTSFAHTGLVASDFTNYLGGTPLHPDFTAGGALFTLGYVTSNSVNGGPITKFSGIDNWRVVLELAPRCPNVTGTPYCFGDGSGPACPCFPSIAPGGAGRGCPNSVFPSGALLNAVGTASIGADTLELRGSAMPNSTCIYFQGTAASASVVFDGISCVTGTVIRLGTKTNACNASRYPDSTNPTVSVRGQVTAPGTRFYQVWYRNAASFCTPATSNYSNGLQINWTL